MTKEALRFAMEALEDIGDEWGFTSQRTVPKRKEAITAIKEALAQPEQEPVGEIVDAIEGAFKCSFTKMLPVGTKLYTTPPQREQDGECKHCTDGCPACDARKLPEQAPVAWGVFEGNLHDMFFSQEEAQKMADLKGTHAEVRPLYATPQRTWVGLTYEEESELIRLAHNHAGIRFYIQAAEAKLKEKNNG
jgi:hypothetical protein